ncbi:MAG: class II glutamine amidotransferase domain-containing protein [Armatimonadota bacterium]
MRGLTGIILRPQSRSPRARVIITNMFSRLLLHSEHRGPHATGALVMTTAGEMIVEKAPMPAHRFIASPAFQKLCARIGSDTTMLMGHTRWPTQGSHFDNQNNQPLIVPGADGLAIAHNGDIPHVSRYFSQFHLEREWVVDSELLLRLAVRHRQPQGIALQPFFRDVACCTGHLAAVLVAAA